MISCSELRERLFYEPDTGEFYWRVKTGNLRKRGFNACKEGARAGTIFNNGYRLISFNGRQYVAHRLAWLYVYGEWPKLFLDHIDRDRDNNAIANLRLATSSENRHNTPASDSNLLGLKGVSRVAKAEASWFARITVDGKVKHLGCFDSPLKAAAAYRDASLKYHGQFSHFWEGSL